LIQGLSFEDLFDKEKLPGQADLANIEQKDTDEPDNLENERLDNELLSQIDDKLDKVLEKLNKGKTYRSFSQCFFNLMEYRLNLQIFTDFFYLPEENGFAAYNESPEVKLSTNKIYALSYMLLLTHVNKVHANNHIHKALAKMDTMANDDFGFGRVLSPFFILAILLYLMNNLVNAGIKSKRPIFQILEGDLVTDFFKTRDFDNKKIKEKIKYALTKTIYIIEYIQDSNLTPDEDYYVKCEILLVNFFSKIELLFDKLMPVLNRWAGIINTFNSRKEMEKTLTGLSSIDRSLAFWIEPKQLDYFDEYVNKIEELQIGLERYYDGYVDEPAIVPRAIEDRHESTGNLSTRSD
jgi:hypothetical protein